MTRENQTGKKPRSREEHVALHEASVLKINKWFEQIQARKKVRISRKDFINWLIEKHPENLSNSDLNAVIERFYDEEAFLRQLLREVRRAKKEGQTEAAIEVVVRTKKSEAKKEIIPATEISCATAQEISEERTSFSPERKLGVGHLEGG